MLCSAVVHSEAEEGLSAEPSSLQDGDSGPSSALPPDTAPYETAPADAAVIGTSAISSELPAEAHQVSGSVLEAGDHVTDSMQSQTPVSISRQSSRASGDGAESHAAGRPDSAAGAFVDSNAAAYRDETLPQAPPMEGSMSRATSGDDSVVPTSDAGAATARPADSPAAEDRLGFSDAQQPAVDSLASSRRTSSRLGSARQQSARSRQASEAANAADASHAPDLEEAAAGGVDASPGICSSPPAALLDQTNAAGQLVIAQATAPSVVRESTAPSRASSGEDPLTGVGVSRDSVGSTAGRSLTSSPMPARHDSATAVSELSQRAPDMASASVAAQPGAELLAAPSDGLSSAQQAKASLYTGSDLLPESKSAPGSPGSVASQPEDSQGLVGSNTEGSPGLAPPSMPSTQRPLGPQSKGTGSLLSPETEGSMVGASLSQLGKEGGAGVIRHSVILTSLDPLERWLYTQQGMLPALDYNKIKADLQVTQRLLSLQC